MNCLVNELPKSTQIDPQTASEVDFYMKVHSSTPSVQIRQSQHLKPSKMNQNLQKINFLDSVSQSQNPT